MTARLVSIVIPCYNYGRYLGEAIESALSQTYSHIEVIVIDDGSTDETREVASRYDVVYIHQENQGPCRAYNNGIRASKGEYFVKLDADDIMDPAYVAKTCEVMDAHPALGYVYTPLQLFGAAEFIRHCPEFDPVLLRRENYLNNTALTRRRAFDDVGGFNPEMTVYEDWDFYLSLAEKGWYGKRLDEPLVYYRRHEANRSAIDHPRALRTIDQIRRNHPKLYDWRYYLRYGPGNGFAPLRIALLVRLQGGNPTLYGAAKRLLLRKVTK